MSSLHTGRLKERLSDKALSRERRLQHLEEHLVEAMKGKPIQISEEELQSGDFIAILSERLKELK